MSEKRTLRNVKYIRPRCASLGAPGPPIVPQGLSFGSHWAPLGAQPRKYLFICWFIVANACKFLAASICYPSFWEFSFSSNNQWLLSVSEGDTAPLSSHDEPRAAVRYQFIINQVMSLLACIGSGFIN